jgi:hypothetical protein
MRKSRPSPFCHMICYSCPVALTTVILSDGRLEDFIGYEGNADRNAPPQWPGLCAEKRSLRCSRDGVGMTRSTVPRMSTACILIAFSLLACGNAAVLAQQGNGSEQASQEASFDIPSQPLAAALSAYGAKSGLQALYESALTANKTSTAIKGVFTPEAALRALLAGTGLVGRRTDVDAVTVAPESRERLADVAPAAPDARFLGALQAGILDAFCRNADTRPGGYRMALQLWIAPTGGLRHTSLLGSTGNARRDDALISQLRDVQIAVRPPPGLSQPITLVIMPRSPLQPPECER